MADAKPDVLAIFSEAVTRETAQQREDFLADACGDDSVVRQRVRTLLRAHFDAGNFLVGDSEESRATIDHPAGENTGSRIGPYKLLQQIGEGGMGVVYMAEQNEPVKRRVALKIIKPGMDSKQVIARFEAERQALAMMDHPNVARVYDAGTMDQGRPYFVMELVKGIPITKYCDANHLSTRERLQLFTLVCEAIQHAHHKGIIHRDLKPSNVLVAEYDDRPVPKIIDFGVAKALNQSLTDKTMFTQYGQIVGTLEYMSPEQSRFNQLDVDTRSDIYSLGVLLYELLTGVTPFDRERLRTSGFDEVLRIIGEEEPPRPSTRLAMSDTLPAVAAGRATDAKHLPGLIRGDLDWIVMKALSKDRSDRYQTPSNLADDVRRHLEFQPIEARRPSVIGRVRRFVKRNRVPVTFGSAALLCVALALAVGAFAVKQYYDLRRQEAETEFEETMDRIRGLMDDGRVVAAYRLALDTRSALPVESDSFQALWENISTPFTLETVPENAEVLICDWNDSDRKWFSLGPTPLDNIRVPRGTVRWKFESASHDTREFVRDWSYTEYKNLRLFQSPEPGMVVVTSSTGFSNTSYRAVAKPFLMDQFEVTNRDYKEFMDAGGYENPVFWKHDFIVDGMAISRKEAMARFIDQTGQPGPATWRDGTFPPHEQAFPVSGVSWYEAAAYAEFRGKKLPTIHHWYSATLAAWSAKYVVPHSNFGDGLAPVGKHDGVGRMRIFDLAGNVAEWCFNEVIDKPGTRCMRGGAWNDPDYMYCAPDVRQAMDRSPRCGFRCAAHRPNDVLVRPVKPLVRSFDRPPASEEVMEVILNRYDHRPELPLNPVAVAVNDADSNDSYRHEAVRIDASYGKEQFDIHFFFPRDARAPYETVVWIPGSGAFDSISFTERRDGAEIKFQAEILSTGRAVCLPVCQGMYGRRSGNTRGIEKQIQLVMDIRRTVDYLQTRPDDIQTDRLIYSGFSFGASKGAIVAAVEDRFKAAVLINGGYHGFPGIWKRPEVDPYNFMSRATTPVLMINGKYDAIFPVKEGQEPYLDHWGAPEAHKKLVHFEGGHGIPTKVAVRAMDQWLKAELPSSR